MDTVGMDIARWDRQRRTMRNKQRGDAWDRWWTLDTSHSGPGVGADGKNQDGKAEHQGKGKGFGMVKWSNRRCRTGASQMLVEAPSSLWPSR